MTMFKKKNTVKNAIKKDGVKVEKKKGVNTNYLRGVEDVPELPKGSILIRFHEDGLSVNGNTTSEQVVEFLTSGLFKMVDTIMEECSFSETRKLLIAMKLTLDLEKFTRDLLESRDEDDSDDD